MPNSGSICTALLLSVMLIVPTPARPAGMAADATANLRPIMDAIFQALTSALPLSLDAQQFQSEKHRKRLHDALRALAENAGQLTRHGQHVSADFDFLRRSLKRNAQEALELFEQGYFEESRFVFQQLTDNCFLCHSRLPSARRFSLGKRVLEQLPMDQLSPHERVRLAVASRQFDTALTTCEAVFRSTDIPAAQIDLMAFFEDYMRIAIRVQADFSRIIKTLETFRQRSDVPRYLDQHLNSWILSLKALQAEGQHDDELTRARTLIQTGQRQNRFLADRQGLVYFMLASSLLHRYVDSGSKSNLQLAEAYYLLGVAESYVPRSSWISETEIFLEAAVRLAPTSPSGKKAYAFLEEYVMTGYTGSSGLHLPSDIQAHLDELRRLLDTP